MRATFPGLAAPVRVVPHGVDVRGPRDPTARARFGVAPDAPFVVQVAGLRTEKGFPSVFALLDAAHERVPALRYALVGPTIDASLEPGAAAWFATRPWAIRAGSLPRAAALDLVATATCTLHASTVEGLSNALLESMALGVAPVARDIPASRAAIDAGATGLLFASDAEGADALVRVVRDASLRTALGAAARTAAAQRFSPGAEAAGYERVLVAAARG